VFALVAPKNIVSNLIAGAVAEAGALQAGDMMQGTYHCTRDTHHTRLHD
jgi:hypothetical protein